MRDLRPLLGTVLLALAALARPAAAQAPAGSASPIAAAPVEAMTAKARELYADGLKAFQQQRWPEAYAAFTGAWALQKHYAVAGNLGATEVQLGRYRDAAEHLAIYTKGIAEDPKRTAKERESARLLFDVATSKIVTMTVSVDVTGADVWIDGARVGAAPLADPVFVEPGKHTVEVKLDGYVTERRSFDAAAGEKKAVEVVLKKRPEGVPAPTAMATASATGTAAPPRSMVPAYVMGGVGLAGVIAGAAFVGIAEGKRAEARELARTPEGKCVVDESNLQGTCEKIAGLSADINAFGNSGISLLVAGGLLAVGGALYFFWPTNRPGASALQVVPLADGRNGGLIVRGSF